MVDHAGLRNPNRVASSSIRGYYYQFLCTLERWLELNENEILWCEGNEDIDRIITTGEVAEEQVKHIAKNFTDASETITNILLQFAHGFQDNHSKGLKSIHIFRTTATLSTSKPKHSPTYEWLKNQQALNEEQVNSIFENIRSMAMSHAQGASPDALDYIKENGLEQLFLSSCVWKFDEVSYEEMHSRFMTKVRLDHRCKGLDPKAVTNAALAKVASVSSSSNLKSRGLSKYDFDCLANDLAIEKQMKSYHMRSDNGERIVAALNREQFCCAVTMRFESIDQTRSALEQIIDEIRASPKYADAELSEIFLCSDIMQNHISQMPFDLFVVVGAASSTKKVETKKRWLASKSVEMSSYRETRPSMIKADEELKEILSRNNNQLHIEAVSEEDCLLELGINICDWAISLCDGDDKNFPLYCIASKIRCIFKWDSQEYFSRQDSPGGWALTG